MERKYYIDNLRLICVLLLIPYHAAMAFNCWGESNYIFIEPSRALSSVVAAISPWYMTLMFVLAGISAGYSMRKRTEKQFLRERAERLLLPLVSGTLTVIPVMAFFADRTNMGYTEGFFEHYGVFFGSWTDLTGYDGGFTIGHLWFLLYLFVISLGGVAVDKLAGERLWERSRTGRVILPVMFALICAMLAKPVELGGKCILTYLILYLTGFYFLSDERNVETLSKYKYVYLTVWILSELINVYLFLWSELELATVNITASYIAGGSGILTLLCFGRELLSKTGPRLKKLYADSLLIYIFHFVWVVVFEYVFSLLTQNNAVIFSAAVICSFIATIPTAGIVGRIPVISFLFGKKSAGARKS